MQITNLSILNQHKEYIKYMKYITNILQKTNHTRQYNIIYITILIYFNLVQKLFLNKRLNFLNMEF